MMLAGNLLAEVESHLVDLRQIYLVERAKCSDIPTATEQLEAYDEINQKINSVNATLMKLFSLDQL